MFLQGESAIIIMSQDFVNSEWCTKEFEECCLENIKDPAFTLFIVMMQGRDTLVKVDQYEDFVKKYLHSDTVLNKDDPHLIKKISSLLKRTQTKNPKPKKYRSKSFFQHLKTKSRSVLMRLGKKQTKKNNIDILVEDFTSEDEHLESPEDLRRNFSSQIIETVETEICDETLGNSVRPVAFLRSEIDNRTHAVNVSEDTHLENTFQLEHLGKPKFMDEMTIVDVHAVDFHDEDSLLENQEGVTGASGVVGELDEENRLEKAASFEENTETNEMNLKSSRTGQYPCGNEDDDDDGDRKPFLIKENRALTKLRSKLSRSRRLDAFVSFHHSGPHRDFVFNKILPELDENHDPPFRLYIHDRDFELGEDIIWNIEIAIQQSNSAIIVMSQGYVESKWCQIKFRECFLESATDSAFRIFVIMMEPEDSLENTNIYMKKFFRETTYGTPTDPNLYIKIGKLLMNIKYQAPESHLMM